MTSRHAVVRRQDCKSIWLLRDHLTPLIGGHHTGGKFAMAITGVHPGDGPPPHVHRREDEAFYILDGEVTFLYADKLYRATPGTFVWAPRDVPHTFKCTSKTPARMLLMVTPTDFLNFAITMAEPAMDFDAPPPLSEEKVAQLVRVAPQYGIELMPGRPMPTETVDLRRPPEAIEVFGDRVCILAGGRETGGRFSFCEISTAPGGGMPEHVHENAEEFVFVIDGAHDLTVDGETTRLDACDAAHIPAGAPHRIAPAGASAGNLFVAHSPAGFEERCREVGKAVRN